MFQCNIYNKVLTMVIWLINSDYRLINSSCWLRIKLTKKLEFIKHNFFVLIWNIGKTFYIYSVVFLKCRNIIEKQN